MCHNRSCCCYSLQHGAIVIGITVMVASAVALLTEIGMIAEWEDIKESLKDPRMQQFVLPVLIVSTVLSSVYLIFSILLLKGIKKRKKLYLIPWLSWSVLYILVAASCCIYELTLGGTILELTLPPILYITIIGSWIYVVYCIHSFFRTLQYEKRAKEAEKNIEEEIEIYAELTKPLVVDIREVTDEKIFPKHIWEDNSSVSNFSDGRKLSLRSLSSPHHRNEMTPTSIASTQV